MGLTPQALPCGSDLPCGTSSNPGPRWDLHMKGHAVGHRCHCPLVPCAVLRVPDGGPLAGRGVPSDAYGTIRLLGWINRLITSRLRSQHSANTLPVTPVSSPPGHCQRFWLALGLPWVLQDGTAEGYCNPHGGSAPAQLDLGNTTALSCLIWGWCSHTGRAEGARHPIAGRVHVWPSQRAAPACFSPINSWTFCLSP